MLGTLFFQHFFYHPLFYWMKKSIRKRVFITLLLVCNNRKSSIWPRFSIGRGWEWV